jgi:glycerate kinase
MHVVVAPDKFKASLSAGHVANAVSRGLKAVLPDLDIVIVPMADGGEGTLDAAMAAGFERVDVPARGPAGHIGPSAIAVHAGRAVIEMAVLNGLLPDRLRDPLNTTSAGVGDLMMAALDRGCREIVLGVGGSVSSDGGAGMLQALGGKLFDGADRPVLHRGRPIGGGQLHRVARVDLTGLDRRLRAVHLVLASDVDSVLLGAHGAATVYGPQKGATTAQVATLESGLAHWAAILDSAAATQPGAGAGGGVGFAALAVLGALRRPGVDVMLELTGFCDRLPGCVLVVTGEGRLDSQTLRGKTPMGVARAAASAGVPVVAVCGQRDLSDVALREAAIMNAHALTDVEPDLRRCLADPIPLLEHLGRRIARRHL